MTQEKNHEHEETQRKKSICLTCKRGVCIYAQALTAEVAGVGGRQASVHILEMQE